MSGLHGQLPEETIYTLKRLDVKEKPEKKSQEKKSGSSEVEKKHSRGSQSSESQEKKRAKAGTPPPGKMMRKNKPTNFRSQPRPAFRFVSKRSTRGKQ